MKAGFAPSMICGALCLSYMSASVGSQDFGTLGDSIAAATETDATEVKAPVTLAPELMDAAGITNGAIETPESAKTGLSISGSSVPEIPSSIPAEKSNGDPNSSKGEPMWAPVPSSGSPASTSEDDPDKSTTTAPPFTSFSQTETQQPTEAPYNDATQDFPPGPSTDGQGQWSQAPTNGGLWQGSWGSTTPIPTLSNGINPPPLAGIPSVPSSSSVSNCKVRRARH